MEKWEEAYSDYKNGLKYREIADKYGISENTVKSWAARKWKNYTPENISDKVAKELENAPEKVAEVATLENEKKKKGGQKGNKNAVGHVGGAPKGNKNNYKHGLYENFTYSDLSSDEKTILNSGYIDKEQELIRTVRFSDIQINRFLKKIGKEEKKKNGLVISGVNKTVAKNKDDEAYYNGTTTMTTAAHDLIIRYYNEIGKITAKKIRCLEALAKIDIEKQRLKILKDKIDKDSGGNGNIDALVDSIEKARKQRSETE